MGFDLFNVLQGILIGAPPVLFAITLHEVAHGWAARHYGDRTAEMMGRLSLNPIKHIDPMGTIIVPAVMYMLGGFMFGWAKPVPVAFGRLNNPKRDMIMVALAGPAANIAMGIGWAVVLKTLLVTGVGAAGVGALLFSMCEIGIIINALLAAFNIIPIPPLDGGRVLRGLVSESVGQYLDRMEPFGLIIIVVLLASGLLWTVVGPLLNLVQRLIVFVVGL